MLEDPRSPEFLEFIDFSSRMDVARRGRHSPWSNPDWLPGNSPDTTTSDPRQCGGERSDVFLSLNEVVAWPSGGETEEPLGAGDSTGTR